ncbi:lysine N(6)-hydroxylase/L-ornithine N(5)-oxygenase family protein [Xenorhabdus bovienii]|uniref:lysine N(6)-hydroxylase/L-ornithine N(5)-oxygenase family protein n=1 Tax=Xenorhabdus bovienii TaxID=40576 RepID=UPI00237C6001|nr:lysine N(6)-hydroxylase/L-ornithine N(5)-oxygenase family protein [Xenorhabdus bovienii]MDE1481629.1 lysine N(6)-hydroxylase/L-ornithine N(5)-oxygenase family protein [Xenorhabdus bovienii]MDE9433271.1 lysine N(6)-hydroxylase/L-ornithine N(5)-oxygenase family protein [Xenorhabdus bovienii]MDE9440456.1 lysine N(6)-hydroxylase/L-ornithine N(5)-oxygenase family protein [Xenorhabdus bovienii]MDE9464401.1 lysine N(6)-hydroxylase/L-ornithine N(5)-oxygenase family protein [Xenorhabdus bovienii]MDE
MTTKTYDFIAIGIGPFNLGLACLVQPIKEITSLFIDQKAGFNWHPGMMLESSTMQTPFMADLVTLASPTHPLSFLNYIKQKGRIYSFYIRESFFLMRKEYNQYCQWAAEQLSNLRFNTRVENISYDASTSLYTLHCADTLTGQKHQFFCKKLVLGTGPSSYIPKCCRPFADHMVTSGDYLENKAALQQKKSITVLGSGQSAAEIFYDLLEDIDAYGYQLNWVTRSPRFFPLEYTKLTLEMTSPEYVDYFYSLPENKREALNRSQQSLYKGINSSLINEIFDLMYTKRLSGELDVSLYTNSELRQVHFIAEKQGVAEEQKLILDLFQHEQEAAFSLETEGLVLATGYQYQIPSFMEGIQHLIRWDKQGRYDVQRNYSIDCRNEIFVQNVELHTHGFVTPDLGMASYRNSCLIQEITGTAHYEIEKSIAFQQFGVASEGVF